MADARADSSADTPAPRSGKSNLVLIVIIAVLATIVVGGGVAVYFVMKGGGGAEEAAPVAEEEAPAVESSTEAKKPDGKKKDAHSGPAIYVGMEPPFVVNFDASQSSRFLQITVQLMTRDQATSQLLRDNDPLLRNDLLLLFGGQNADTLGTRDGKEALRKQALDTVRAVVKAEGGKPDLVEAVYFTSFVMQ